MADNLRLYEQGRAVPEAALKPIKGGRLKGMSDINPMWRIQKLTEMFGPCGIGWWYEVTNRQIYEDSITKQAVCFVDINLYYVDPESGKCSAPIPGMGGSSILAQEQNGPYLSDEGFKMALTDAISISAKAIGIGADVWFAAGRTKYTATQEELKKDFSSENNASNADFKPTCAMCGATITVAEHDYSVKRFKQPLCRACQKKA